MNVATLSLDASLSFEQRLIFFESAAALAVSHNANILLLPELSYSGYEMNEAALERYPYAEAVDFFCKLSSRYGLAIGFGAPVRAGSSFLNRYAVVDGELMLAEYDKIHIFSFGGENLFFSHGNSLKTFEMCGINFGLAICYDLRFPEIFSLYGDSCGAVILPSAWPKKRVDDFTLLLRSRALENNIQMIGVNWQGVSNQNIEYSKSSFAANARGEPEDAVFASNELDIFKISLRRFDSNTPNVLSDKKYGLYAKLYAAKHH